MNLNFCARLHLPIGSGASNSEPTLASRRRLEVGNKLSSFPQSLQNALLVDRAVPGSMLKQGGEAALFSPSVRCRTGVDGAADPPAR
jgi:hypothetical protein